MKKLIALLAAVALMLSLTACIGTGTSQSTADEAKAADIDTYDKDFNGLVKYISDSNSGSAVNDVLYDVLGACNGKRIVINNNQYVEVYDFTNITGAATPDSATPDSATPDTAAADSADPEKAASILADVKENGAFTPLEDGIEMTAVITDSGRYVIAWDPGRSYDYTGKIATDELKSNW